MRTLRIYSQTHVCLVFEQAVGHDLYTDSCKALFHTEFWGGRWRVGGRGRHRVSLCVNQRLHAAGAADPASALSNPVIIQDEVKDLCGDVPALFNCSAFWNLKLVLYLFSISKSIFL